MSLSTKYGSSHNTNNPLIFSDYISLDGVIRIISEVFTVALLDRDTQAYRAMAEKYEEKVMMMENPLSKILPFQPSN